MTNKFCPLIKLECKKEECMMWSEDSCSYVDFFETNICAEEDEEVELPEEDEEERDGPDDPDRRYIGSPGQVLALPPVPMWPARIENRAPTEKSAAKSPPTCCPVAWEYPSAITFS